MSFEGADDILLLDLGSVSIGDNLLCHVSLFRCILIKNVVDLFYAIEN